MTPKKSNAAATLATVLGLQAWLRNAEAHPENPYFARRIEAMARALGSKTIDDVSERGIVNEAILAYGQALAQLRRDHAYLGFVPVADMVTDAIIEKNDRFISGKLAPSDDAIRFARDLAERLPRKEPERGKVVAIDSHERRDAIVRALAQAIEASSRVGRRSAGAPMSDAKGARDDALRALGLPGSDDAIKRARRRAKKQR